MPISSLVVHVHRGGIDAVKSSLSDDSRIEISDVVGDSLVLLTETKDRDEDFEIWSELQSRTEIESVNLIYHNHEDLESHTHATNTP